MSRIDEDGWIPISEYDPKVHGEDVLISVDESNFDGYGTVYKSCQNHKGDWIDWEEHYCGDWTGGCGYETFNKGDVTHFQPLPRGAKKGGGE